MGKLESTFKTKLIAELKQMFPGCYVLHNDPGYIQGIPDLIVLWGPYWATLEGKRSLKDKYQPNQEWYIADMNNQSFSRMICPENKEEVLDELQRAFQAPR